MSNTPKMLHLAGPRRFSERQVAIFAVAFALIGGYIIFRTFAAGTTYGLTSSLADGSTVAGTIDWSVSVSPQPKSIEFYIDGVKDPVVDSISPYSYKGTASSLDTTKLTNGLHVLQETVVYASSSAIATHKITVNNTAATPAPVPTPPPPPAATNITQTIVNGSTIKGTVAWIASTSNDSNVSSVDFYLDGVFRNNEVAAPWASSDPPQTDAGLVDTTKLINGSHVFKATANLKDGTKLSVSSTATVANTAPPPPPSTLDTTPPTVPTGFKVTSTSKSSVSLVWNASTDNKAVAGYRLYRGTITTPIYDGSSLGITNTGLNKSTSYTYYVRAYDKAGNMSAPGAKICVGKWGFWNNFSRSRSWKYC